MRDHIIRGYLSGKYRQQVKERDNILFFERREWFFQTEDEMSESGDIAK